MVRLVPLAFLLLTALLSGCAGDPGTTEAADPVDPAGTAASDGDQDAQDASPGMAEPGPAEPAAATCRVTVVAGSGVQGNLQNAYNTCRFEEAADEVEAYGSALVEAAFPQAQPTQTRFYLYLLSESCDFSSGLEPCWHAMESSATPSVRLEAPAALLQDFGRDGLRAYASLDGVAVQQDIVIAVTLVPVGHVLPEGYTALE